MSVKKCYIRLLFICFGCDAQVVWCRCIDLCTGHIALCLSIFQSATFHWIVPWLHLTRCPHRIDNGGDNENDKCDPEHQTPFIQRGLLILREEKIISVFFFLIDVLLFVRSSSALTFGVRNPTRVGATTPVMAPMPLVNAMIEPA